MREIWSLGSGGRPVCYARKAIAAAIFLTMSSACSSPISATTDSVEFMCNVSGASMLKPSATDASVCSAFKQRIDAALPKATKAVVSASGADWIQVDVRFSKPGIASAVLTRKDGAGKIVHPEVAVSVMDKPLGDNEVKMLAEEVAKLVSAKG